MDTVVVKGPNDPGVAEGVARALGARVADVYTKRFPDNELYIRLDKAVAGADIVVVVDTLYPKQDAGWIRLLFMVDAARRLSGGAPVIGVVPYLAYSRQDKVFLEGEPVSIEVLLRALRGAGLDALYTIDVHSPASLAAFRGHAVNIHVADILARSAAESLANPVVLAPDKGAVHRARIAAEAIGTDYDYFVKKRDRYTGEITMEPRATGLGGRDVLIIDDIISTGGTIALAAQHAKRLGARRVVAACSHPLLVGGARDKMTRAGVERLYAANTIPYEPDQWLIRVDVSTRIAEAIRSHGW